MNIGIIINSEKRTYVETINQIVGRLVRNNVKVLIPAGVAQLEGLQVEMPDMERFLQESDYIISLGGDGTFLKAARHSYEKNIPVLGINLGNVGFLTEVEKEEIDPAIEQFLSGGFTIEDRTMLEARIFRNGEIISTDCALNEIVISRAALSHILHIKTYIDGTYVDTFPGDGLIISSPTGSTGYSLSAGGPIVEPDADLMIITPICPHILYSRSIVVSCQKTVKALIDEDYRHIAMVVADGQDGYDIRGGDYIQVTISDRKIRFVRLQSHNFFNIFRRKIYYGNEIGKR